MSQENKKKKKIYGMELILELFDCNLKCLTSKRKIKEFIQELCQRMKIQRVGPVIIKRYKGEGFFGEGYSFCQFIIASSITGHFIETDRLAFLNIFSCKSFDVKKATSFCQKFFQAKRVKNKLIVH